MPNTAAALFLTALLLLPFSQLKADEGECPSSEKIGSVLEKISGQKLEILKVRPGPFPGLCETILNAGGKASIVYSDPAGRYLVSGQIIDTLSSRDLTREAVAEFNRFTPEEMKKVDSLAALTVGTKGPVFYFVSDPL